jgi:hypothetical protein
VNGSESDDGRYAVSPANAVATEPAPVGPSSSIEVAPVPVAAEADRTPMVKLTVRGAIPAPLRVSVITTLTAAGSEYCPEPPPV